MTIILKPIHILDSIGELAVMPDGAIINIGGTSMPTFTVGGKGLLFDDFTSTSGTPIEGLSLQGAYTNSATPANINLTTGKDLSFTALNGKKFVFSAATGLVTIEGDLTVLGETTVIEGEVSNLDRVNIQPPRDDEPALTIEPLPGIVPTVALVDIKVENGGPTIFSIGPTGTTSVLDLFISETINGVDIDDLLSHINSDVAPAKHTAEQISADTTGLTSVTGSNVQEVIESINSTISSLSVNNVKGYEYVQVVPSASWTISHSSGSVRVQASIWDEDNSLVFADDVAIIDANTVQVTFNTPQAGRAILMLF